MQEIPRHATLAQMREASQKLQRAARAMGLEPLPDQAPWPSRVWQVQRTMASLPFSYMCADTPAITPMQLPEPPSRWERAARALKPQSAQYGQNLWRALGIDPPKNEVNQQVKGKI